MSYSILLERDLKAQACNILASGNNRTAEQLFIELKKKSIFCTKRGIYKALTELLNKKVIIKFGTNYEINQEWLSLLQQNAQKALLQMFEKNFVSKSVQHLKQACICGSGDTEGFCSICFEIVCNHCAAKQMKHTNCAIKCFNCKCSNSDDTCINCGEKSCLRCAKTIWSHEYQFCKKNNVEKQIAILEVDHQCWFSNTSEKYPEEIILKSFSDKQDINAGTHSGIVKISTDDKHKLLNRILKQDIVREAKLIHKTNNAYYIRTRALINKSVDEFTKKNKSVLLNPVIAVDSKEQNLIISPSQKEMKAMSKGLQEFGGKVRLICAENFNVNQLHKIENKKIREFIEKVPKQELLEAVQKCG
ncbi:hypothetical protein HZA96_05310 [Candidatus Woesearchaeota archaeon]|nr:hypothetical protein [Candidatus Woesearchaeota archaeon]